MGGNIGAPISCDPMKSVLNIIMHRAKQHILLDLTAKLFCQVC